MNKNKFISWRVRFGSMSFVAGIIAFLGLTNGGVSTPNSTTAKSSNPYNINLKINIEIFHKSKGEVDNHPKNHLFRGKMTTPPLHMGNSGLVQAKWGPKIICNFKLHLAKNNMTQEQGVRSF